MVGMQDEPQRSNRPDRRPASPPELRQLLSDHVPDRDLRAWIETGGDGRKDIIVSVDVDGPVDLLLDRDADGRARLRGIEPKTGVENRLYEAANYVKSLVGVTPVTLRAARAICASLSADQARALVGQAWVDSVYLNRHLGAPTP